MVVLFVVSTKALSLLRTVLLSSVYWLKTVSSLITSSLLRLYVLITASTCLPFQVPRPSANVLVSVRLTPRVMLERLLDAQNSLEGEGNAHVDQSLDFLRSVHTQLPRNQRSPVMSTTKTASSPPATASMSASKSPTTFEQKPFSNNGKHASASKIRGYRPVSQGQKRSHLVLPGVPELWESVDEEDDLISSRSGCWNLSHVHAGIRMLESGFVFYGV
ncbi:hypothetical protein HID58_029329 [Brassica napus]|uniref:Uncharacterized protein n=1 Tax=Brassica napus TaxID=3708 RepID=A0ABQ8CCV7_BRANA|nr:hypothetical protein HID58_029329 [Brassica napus]